MGAEKLKEMCQFFPDEPATQQFWTSWGEEGYCCNRAVMLLNQKADNMNGGADAPKVNWVRLSQLANVEEPPLERSERTQLIAARLSAEAERDEVAARNARMLERENVLTSDLNKARGRAIELEAQLTEARSDLAREKSSRDNYARMVSQLEKQVAEQNKVLQARDDSREEVQTALAQVSELKTSLAEAQSELEAQRSRANELASQVDQLRAASQE